MCESFIIAAIVALALAMVPVHVWNAELFRLLNDWHSPITDHVWLAFTTLGDGLLLGIILGCFLLVNPRVAVVGLVLMLACSVAVNVIKAVYTLPRPSEALAGVHVLGPLLRWGSFPSGHTGSSVAAALGIAMFGPSRLLGGVALAVAVMISLSRIFVGAHFPQDVVGGAIIALCASLLFLRLIWPRLRAGIPDAPVLSSPVFKAAIGLEVLAALFTFSFYAEHFAEWRLPAAMVAVAVLGFVAVRLRDVARSANGD